jgi:hypothetical protein
MNYTFYDLIGNIGVALIIVSYLLLQLRKIKSDNIIYSVMNATGAVFVIVSLTENFNMSAFIIEFFWVCISLIGIYRYFISKFRKT